MTTVGQWISKPTKVSSLEKEYILQSLLKKTKSEIHLSWNEPLTKNQLQKCFVSLSLYEKGVPLAYILKETEFYSLRFQLDKNVFIPRIDTEVLVEVTLNHFQKSPPHYFMDWGCGSGCIGLTLLQKWKLSHLICVDKSLEAVSCTRKNASSFNLSDERYSLFHQNILSLDPKNFSPISLIVANPPYIAWKDPHVSDSVKLYEPHTALYSGSTGLECIKNWLEKAIEFLSIKGGDYIFEIGFNQFEKVQKLIEQYPLICDVKFYKDSQKHYRVVHCVIKK